MDCVFTALVRPHDGKYLALLWLGYFSFVGTAWLALTTQLSMLLFLGWFGFAWFQVRGQPKLSGASLALALVKPQSVVLLLPVLVWKRQWQTLAYFAIGAAPMIVLSLVVAGPSALIEYPRFLLDSTRWEGLGVNTATMFGWNRLLYFLTGDLSPNVGFVLALSVPTVALAAVALRGAWNPAQPRFHLQVGTLLLATLLINPHLYLQDLILLPLVLGFFAAYEVRTRGSVGIITAGLAGIIWLLVRLNWINFPALALVTVAMGLLLCGLTYLTWHSLTNEASTAELTNSKRCVRGSEPSG